jgi:ribosomal protein S18 acetylase RimI-like enzyme
MPILIRTATVADVEFLTHSNAAMALETEKRTLDPERLRKGVRALFEDPTRGVYYIAEMHGERAGQMMITHEWSDWRNGNFWWIQSVWVEPRFRGQGVFGEIYSHVEALARADAQVCGLRLYVEKENTRAQRTYARCGMRHADYEMFETDFVLGE